MEPQTAPGTVRPALPSLGLPHHRAYVVSDLEQAATSWHQLTGIGPFIVVPHVQFDELTVCGTPSVLDHTAAFAAFGAEFIELQVIHGISPEARAIYGADVVGAALHHMAFAASDPDTASASLTAAGAPRTVAASGGGLDVVLHDASHFTGTRIEIHRDTAFFRAFFAEVRSASADWNGQDLLTPFPA